MTARNLYEYGLIELNKLEAPSLLTEDYVYFLNKAVQQCINLTYNRYDTNQQSTDDLRVLKTTALLQNPKKLENADDLASIQEKINSGILSSTYYVDLPKDYMHMLNCIVGFTRTENPNKKTHCDNEAGTKVYFTAKRLTADMYGGVINNYYQKPSYKRPYYYLNNINIKDSIITDQNTDTPLLKYSEGEYDKDGTLINTHYLNDKNLSGIEGEPGNRLANPSNVRLELRFGDDTLYTPTEVYIEYIKAPMYIRLSQEQIDDIVDSSQILEFPDYMCYEILNIFVRLIMENASDPRLQTNIPINQTIPEAQFRN